MPESEIILNFASRCLTNDVFINHKQQLFILKLVLYFIISITSLLASIESFASEKDAYIEVSNDNVLATQRNLTGDPENPTLLQGLGMYMYRADDLQKASEYADRLLKVAEKTKDRDYSEMWGSYIKGAVLASSAEDTHAFKYLEKARNIAESTGNQYALASIYNTFGLFYLFNHNDPFTATNYYYEALEAAKETKDYKKEAALTANLAAAYLTMEDPSGLKLAEQAVALSEKHDKGFTIKPRIILAETYLLADSIAKASQVLRTIEENESEKDKESQVFALKYLRASIHEKEGDFSKAAEIYDELLDSSNKEPSSISYASLAYARMLEKEKDYGRATAILENALENSRDSKVQIHSSKIMEELMRLYKKTGRLEKALDMSLEYQAYRDSLYTIGHHRSLQENRIRHEVYTHERQIDEQRMQIASKNHKITLLLAGIFLMTALVIVILTTARKRERLYHTIVARNSEFIERNRLQTEEIQMLKKELEERPQPPDEKPKAEKPERDLNAELMQRFSEYMEKEQAYADQQLTIAAAAKALGTNRTYLSKAINATTGKTFLQTVNEYRMRRAVELISDIEADIPLKQISADLGYNSISTFYGTFQSYTGMTPAKYRSRVREMRDSGLQNEAEDTPQA